MFQSNKNIYLQETEVKPNKYATLVLSVCVAVVIICWVLTEIGIFKADKEIMRIGTLVPLILLTLLLSALLIFKQLYANPKTKYVILFVAAVYTMIVTTLLTFHTTIMCLFPGFIAMLYKSKRLGRVAVGYSLVCTVCSPVLGYLLSAWDIPLLQELIHIGTNATVELTGATDVKTMESVLKILLYMSFPRFMMVGSFSMLIIYVVGLGEASVNSQILLNEIGHRDALTGLFNQNYLKEFVDNAPKEGDVGIIFFDVNGLKSLNDSKGHEAGDLLLKRFGDSIKMVTDDETSAGFRAGGDEFIIIMPDADKYTIKQKIEDWENALLTVNQENFEQENGITVSAARGYSVGPMSNIEELIKRADKMMYNNKESIHSQHIKI